MNLSLYAMSYCYESPLKILILCFFFSVLGFTEALGIEWAA